jgi:undecaprenyl-diphosphatase
LNDPIEAPATHPPTSWAFRREMRTAGIAIAAALWLAALILGGAGFGLDEQVYHSLYASIDPVFIRNARFLTRLGSWTVLVPVTVIAAIFLAYRRRIRAALLLIMVFGGRLLVELQKVVVDRPRPGVSPHLEAVHSMSFPSGHSANAMITYLAIAMLLPVPQRMRAILVGIALAIALQVGWSRVALGVHWPSDVVGGWAFGLFWVAVCMRLASERPEGETAR